MNFFSSLLLLQLLCQITPSPQSYTVIPLRHRVDLAANFLQPTDVAVGKNNFIYVMDGVNNTVKVFDEKGVFQFSFGGKGGEPGKCNRPVGIATDMAGQVYVADTGNRRIQMFSAGGTFKQQLLMPSTPGGDLREPVDVAVAEGLNRLYVSDNENHQVLVYSSPDYTLLSTWGSEGSRVGQFHYPFLIASGENNALLVVDVLNSRVQIWREDRAVVSIGSFGVDLGQFYRPKGVCADRNGAVYVSDSVLGVIQVFSGGGEFKAVLGTEQGEVLKWKTPVGITVDQAHRLYVVEMIPNRVRVYDILSDRPIEKKYLP